MLLGANQITFCFAKRVLGLFDFVFALMRSPVEKIDILIDTLWMLLELR